MLSEKFSLAIYFQIIAGRVIYRESSGRVFLHTHARTHACKHKVYDVRRGGRSDKILHRFFTKTKRRFKSVRSVVYAYMIMYKHIRISYIYIIYILRVGRLDVRESVASVSRAFRFVFTT